MGIGAYDVSTCLSCMRDLLAHSVKIIQTIHFKTEYGDLGNDDMLPRLGLTPFSWFLEICTGVLVQIMVLLWSSSASRQHSLFLEVG